MGVPSGRRAHGRHDHVGTLLPVGVGGPGGGAEEHEPGEVLSVRRVLEHRSEQGTAERVGGQDIGPRIRHPRRRAGDRVQEPLQRWPDGRFWRASAAADRRRPCGTREVVQVLSLGLVESQRSGDGVEDLRRDAGEIAALHPGVVVAAHPGEHRDLLATQPGHPAAAAADDPGLVGGEAGPAGAKELPHFGLVVHGPMVGRPFRGREELPVHG